MAWTAQDAKNVSFSATSGERCWFYRYECNDTYDSKREKPTESEMSRWNYEDVNRIFGLATLTGAVCELRFFFRMFITNVLAYWQTAEKRNKFRKRKWFCGIYRRLFSLFLFLLWLIAGVCLLYSKTSSCRESDFGCIRLFMQNSPR